MNEGRIEQMGTPEEVYENPASPFVYDFLGNVNLFHGRVHKGKLNVGSVELEAPEHKHISNVDGVARKATSLIYLSYKTKRRCNPSESIIFSRSWTCRICRIKTRRNR
ncbi:hypothetical protein ACT7C5_18960 [Bacillus pacificus]